MRHAVSGFICAEILSMFLADMSIFRFRESLCAGIF
jgi:hypothetical protein